MPETHFDNESNKKVSVENSEENDDTVTKEDKLSKAIGELGPWQLFLIVILSIPSKMSAGWNVLGIIFLAPKTQYTCLSRNNSTEGILNFTCYSDCDQYGYITEFEDSIITQFELICERAWLANLVQTIFMFGVLVGSMVFGFMADRYGRRKTLLTAAMMQLVLSLLLPLCPEYWSFTIVRFFLGTSSAGIMVVTFVIIIEITGPSKRELISTVYHIPLAFAEMIMPLFAYYLRSWQAFSLGVGVPNVLFLMYIFLVPESPRWLISMGRLEEASAIMKKAAIRNKLPSNNILKVAQAIANETNKNKKQDKQTASYIDLITNSNLRMRNFFSCLSWFILGLSFYGGNQYVGQTSTNVFITVVLAGGLQIPGILVSGFLSKCFGRRLTLMLFFIITGISSSLLAVPDSWFYVKMIAGSLSVSCAAGAFSVMYAFTSELFPTVARNMAMGVSSTASRVGSMLAPFVTGITHGAWIPPLIFAVGPLIAAAVCWYLPETKGKKLMDRLDDE